jgi:glycosyl-4,4'-diaponeurosporenoate acyltransferase
MPAKAITGRKTSAELERMLQETCVAEWIHVLLGLLGFGCLWLWPGWGGMMAALVYFVGNLPFVLVQRYNRPRLRRLLERTKNREEEVG